MQMITRAIGRSIAIQIASVAAIATAYTHIIEKIGYKGPFNAVIMLLVIVVIAINCNRGFPVTLFMAIILFLVFFLSVGVNGWMFGYLD